MHGRIETQLICPGGGKAEGKKQNADLPLLHW
jgi:hypothetical protein